DHGHPLLLGPILIPAPPSAEQTTAMLGRAGHLSQSLRVHGGTAVVDCGRASPASAAWTLVVSADVVVLVTRPRLDHVQHASWQLGALRGERSPVVIALVGSRPYPASEVAAALDTPVAAVIADDAPTAEHLPRLALDRTTLRTPLVRSAQTLVVAVHRLAGADTEPSTHPSVEGAGR
ncbi:MAG TPA: hypothetical protein VM618_12665, partial [Acidimicrobiia bacterium]|nr:hypothetical protein [Acidimicrobiia bacterium]